MNELHEFSVVAAMIAVACAFGLRSSAHAQAAPTTFGVGYAANAPEAMAGGSAHVVFPLFGGLGLYVDAKFDVSGPSREDSYISTFTAIQAEEQVSGAEFITAEDSWRSFNVAVVRPVSSSLTLYAGAGYANRKRYHQYREPSGDLGRLGYFWVEDPDQEWDTLNGLFGGFFRLTRWIDFQFGVETRPRGFTVGTGLRLPPR